MPKSFSGFGTPNPREVSMSDSIRVKTTLEIERLGVREYRGLL